MDAKAFFDAVDRYVYAQDEFVKNRTPQAEAELKASGNIVRQEVYRVREILKQKAQAAIPAITWDKLI